MKPRTKKQKEIVERAAKLSPLSEYEKRLMFRHALPHIAKRAADGTVYCLDCGKTFNNGKGDKKMKLTCPHCGAKLEVDTTRKRVFDDKVYTMKIEQQGKFKVFRMFMLSTRCRKGEAAQYWVDEVFQRWTTDGDFTGNIVGRKRLSLGFYVDRWDWSSDLELRNECYAHSVSPSYVLRRFPRDPMLKRNGFDGDFHGVSPAVFLTLLLSNVKFETLLKTGQYDLLRQYAYQTNFVERHWPSVKIAMRHNYKVEDASLWLDMLNSMSELGKDLRNPSLICPKDLRADHDYWMGLNGARRRKAAAEAERRRNIERVSTYLADAARAEQDEADYKTSKSKFFDIEIKDSLITITPLKSVQEFIEEGTLMHHCVFTNNYFKRNDSLILHAVVDGEIMETIEINLKSLCIMQSRSKYNQPSKYHQQILDLMNRNLHEIAKRMKAA